MARAITYFDKARAFASALMIAAGTASILGAALEWVTITPPPTVPDAELAKTQPYSGLEAGDGWWVVALSIVLIAAGIALAASKSRTFARMGFVVAIIMGGIAIADVRSVGEFDSAISQKMDIVGDPDPAFGVKLVAVGAVLAFIGAAIGLAASPRDPEDQPA